MVVQALMSEHGMSERRACQASGIARSILRYRPVARGACGAITFIQTHMALNPRHGFGLLYDSARHPRQALGQDGALARVLRDAAEPAAARQETAASAHQAASAGRRPAQPGLELRLHV